MADYSLSQKPQNFVYRHSSHCIHHKQFTVLDTNHQELILQTVPNEIIFKKREKFATSTWEVHDNTCSKKQGWKKGQTSPLLTQGYTKAELFLCLHSGELYPFPRANTWEWTPYSPLGPSNWYSHLNCKSWISSQWPFTQVWLKLWNWDLATSLFRSRIYLTDFSSHCLTLTIWLAPPSNTEHADLFARLYIRKAFSHVICL